MITDLQIISFWGIIISLLFIAINQRPILEYMDAECERLADEDWEARPKGWHYFRWTALIVFTITFFVLL